MRRFILLLSCLGVAVPVFAQFNAILYTMEPFQDVCYFACSNTIPDGEVAVFVYWDSNGNGPDSQDPLAPDVVQNTYPLNGAEFLEVPGAFYTDPAFTNSSYTPNPSRFYVRIEWMSVQYTSGVVTIPSGYSEFDLTGTWQCEDFIHGCIEPWEFYFTSDPWINPLETCFDLCPFQDAMICFENRAANEQPLITFLQVCDPMGDCLSNCCHAVFEFNEEEWAYDSSEATWCNWIHPILAGCVCLLEVTPDAVQPSDPNLVAEYALHQNFPNPFNASTNIEYDVVTDSHVTLMVRNLLGRTVTELVNSRQAAGRHTVTFDATNLTSGLYFYTVKIGNEFAATKKMLLVK